MMAFQWNARARPTDYCLFVRSFVFQFIIAFGWWLTFSSRARYSHIGIAEPEHTVTIVTNTQIETKLIIFLLRFSSRLTFICFLSFDWITIHVSPFFHFFSNTLFLFWTLFFLFFSVCCFSFDRFLILRSLVYAQFRNVYFLFIRMNALLKKNEFLVGFYCFPWLNCRQCYGAGKVFSNCLNKIFLDMFVGT